MLRRLKLNGASVSELTIIYCQHVKIILEYASVVWHSGLTSENRSNIERVQKCALAIILGKDYISYENAMSALNLESLGRRREKLCIKFAKKSFLSEKFLSWFVPDENPLNTRRKIKTVKPALARTTRFGKSALPYLTSTLNNS